MKKEVWQECKKQKLSLHHLIVSEAHYVREGRGKNQEISVSYTTQD